jgi:hypothetical protein
MHKGFYGKCRITTLLAPPTKAGPVVVRSYFEIHEILEIDEEEETFGFSGVLNLTPREYAE